MKLDQWLDSKRGRTQAMANHFNVTIGAIYQWRNRPPAKRLLEIEEFTKHDVTVHEMLEQLAAKGSA